MKQLLKITDLEKILKLDKWAIYRMVRSGDIPSIKMGRNIRFDPDEINKWIESLKKPVTEKVHK